MYMYQRQHLKVKSLSPPQNPNPGQHRVDRCGSKTPAIRDSRFETVSSVQDIHVHVQLR
jgi:hypothetical protein